MFESAMSMFVAPIGVGVVILAIEYFSIRRVIVPSIRLSAEIQALIFITVLLCAAGMFGKYQFDQTNGRIEATRQQIREYHEENPAFAVRRAE